jgi:hypothetical protein
MANKFRGEVEFEALGQKWTLRLGMNAWITLQEELGFAEDDAGFLSSITRVRGMKKIRTMIEVGLREKHPEMTPQIAGDIITDLSIPRATQLVQQALMWAMPDVEAETETGKAPSPGGSS